MPIIVRPAASDDIPALSELWYENRLLRQQADRRFSLVGDARQQWANAALSWLEDPQQMIYAALEDRQIVGLAHGALAVREVGLLQPLIGLVHSLVLDVHGYHAGAGRMLVDALRGWFRTQGAREMRVSVPRRSAVEQAFWRALGGQDWMDELWLKL